jgi:hypothetical protein
MEKEHVPQNSKTERTRSIKMKYIYLTGGLQRKRLPTLIKCGTDRTKHERDAFEGAVSSYSSFHSSVMYGKSIVGAAYTGSTPQTKDTVNSNPPSFRNRFDSEL